MNRLILSHFAVAAFVAAIAAAWEGLSFFYANDFAQLAAIVGIFGGVTLYFVVSQARAAVNEIRLAVLYPSGGVRNQAGRCDPVSEPTN